jgi:hypothetical protein
VDGEPEQVADGAERAPALADQATRAVGVDPELYALGVAARLHGALDAHQAEQRREPLTRERRGVGLGQVAGIGARAILAGRTIFAGRTILARRTILAGRAILAGGALLAWRTVLSRRTLLAGRAIFAGRAILARWPVFTGAALPGLARRTIVARRVVLAAAAGLLDRAVGGRQFLVGPRGVPGDDLHGALGERRTGRAAEMGQVELELDAMGWDADALGGGGDGPGEVRAFGADGLDPLGNAL